MLYLIDGLIYLFAICPSWCVTILEKGGPPMVETSVDLRSRTLSLDEVEVSEIKFDAVVERIPAIRLMRIWWCRCRCSPGWKILPLRIAWLACSWNGLEYEKNIIK